MLHYVALRLLCIFLFTCQKLSLKICGAVYHSKLFTGHSLICELQAFNGDMHISSCWWQWEVLPIIAPVIAKLRHSKKSRLNVYSRKAFRDHWGLYASFWIIFLHNSLNWVISCWLFVCLNQFDQSIQINCFIFFYVTLTLCIFHHSHQFFVLYPS